MDETELAVKNAEIQQHHALTVYQSKVELAKVASGIGLFFVKSLILVNGGAVVALLGLLSGLGGPPDLAANLANPTLAFITGIVTGMISVATAFFGQGLYNADKDFLGNVCAGLSYVSGALGLAAFAWGAYEAVTAIAMFNPVN